MASCNCKILEVIKVTETMYRTIWAQTEKAVRYLHKKGCMTLCDSIPSGYGEAHFLAYNVSDADKKAQTHVRKSYPYAKINFVDRATVVYGQLERDIAFADYRMSL